MFSLSFFPGKKSVGKIDGFGQVQNDGKEQSDSYQCITRENSMTILAGC